jgi:hypothetical protein
LSPCSSSTKHPASSRRTKGRTRAQLGPAWHALDASCSPRGFHNTTCAGWTRPLVPPGKNRCCGAETVLPCPRGYGSVPHRVAIRGLRPWPSPDNLRVGLAGSRAWSGECFRLTPRQPSSVRLGEGKKPDRDWPGSLRPKRSAR